MPAAALAGTACSRERAGMVLMMDLVRLRVHLLLAALVLALLIAVTPAAPALGEGPVLTTPDRRAIPLLVTKGKTQYRYGTGVIVSATTIITAGHAVAGTVDVILPKVKVTGRVVCRMQDRDVAVLTAKLPRGTPRYRVAFRTVKTGEAVRVGGYPGRKWKTASGRVTHMIKSAILSGRRVTTPMVVFKPALHQGASGSPVLDGRGQVVGIFVASNAQSNYSIAIPTATGLGSCRSRIK
jgi:S1-C subfamily serine protease